LSGSLLDGHKEGNNPVKYRLLGLLAALFFALAITCSFGRGALRPYGNAALEWGVKVILVAAVTATGIIDMLMKKIANFLVKEARHA